MAQPEDADSRKKITRWFIIIDCVQAGLGVALLACGAMAVHYTQGSSQTFGPPYYVGAFIAGILILLAGLAMFFVIRMAKPTDPTSTLDLQKMGRMFFLECALCVLCCMGCLIGLIIDGTNGLNQCDPNEWASFCNYSVNMSENRTVAIFILLLLLATAVVCITTICLVCKVSPIFGVQRTGGQTFRIVGQSQTATPLVIVGGAQSTGGNTFTHTTTGYQYPTVTIQGGGFGAQATAAGYPTGVQPPPTAGYQYGTQPSAMSYPAAEGQREPTIAELQEQNRLLQEQLRLQQQLQQLQQNQQSGSPGQPFTNPPPPSYEDCVTDVAKIRELQEENTRIQEQLKHNAATTDEKGSLEPSTVAPSAPPRYP